MRAQPVFRSAVPFLNHSREPGRDQAPKTRCRNLISSSCLAQEWIVRVTFGSRHVKGGLIRCVERSILTKTLRQIRMRQTRHAKRNRVGLSSRQYLVGGGLGEFFIGNITPAK